MLAERFSCDQSFIEQWAVNLAQYLDFPVFIALEGGLGAGKSTFARAFLREASGEQDIPSPTFAIVQEYPHRTTGLSIVHADLYRLVSAEELSEIGFAEMLCGAIALVEWPGRVAFDIEMPRWTITLSGCPQNDSLRNVCWELPGNATLLPGTLQQMLQHWQLNAGS